VTIGQLYNAANVVVGQAAVLVGPANTPLPPVSAAVLSDPFSITPWTAATVGTSTGPLTAGSYTLTYTYRGVAYVTAANQYNDPAATVQPRIVTALASFPGGAAQSGEVVVAGGPPSAAATPLTIALAERLVGGVWTITPTGITGGTLTVTSPLWTPVGATDQGWTFASNKTTQDVTIEEQSTLISRLVTSQQLTVTGGLSEDISSTLAMVYNMLLTINAPTVTNPGYDLLTLTDTVIQYAVALIMANNLGYPRWLYIPACTCLANVSAAMRRAAAKRIYSAEFTSVCQTSLITITNITSTHS
jgi:hypothetical protein